MTDRAIRDLILQMRLNPDYYDIAPSGHQAFAINQRRLYETHPCAMLCGLKAVAAYIAESPERPEFGPRWLDLCAEDNRRFRVELDLMRRELGQLSANLGVSSD